MDFPRITAGIARASGIASRRGIIWGIVLVVLLGVGGLPVQGQIALQQQQAVGGISVDAAGIIKNLEKTALADLAQEREQALQPLGDDVRHPSQGRRISLKRLDAAIGEAVSSGRPLSDELRYLAGLQRVQYIFVYPDQQDVVLIGPADGWKVDSRGHVVGITSQRPVILLDDLLVAMRYAPQSVISCSIDPTNEGLRRLHEYVSKLTRLQDSKETLRTIEHVLGPQTITIQGVPADCRFARVLVAADYRMKRLGMNLDPSPVPGIKSYLQLVSVTSRGMQATAPRFWLEPKYEPLRTDEQRLAWEIRGAGVLALTEESHFAEDGGKVRLPNRSNIQAQRWTEDFTKHYGELAQADPIFAELSNLMDLSIVGALLVHERLLEKGGLAPQWIFAGDQMPTEKLLIPRQVPTHASAVAKAGGTVISASGGVEIDSLRGLRYPQLEPALAQQHAKARQPEGASGAEAERWWWDPPRK